MHEHINSLIIALTNIAKHARMSGDYKVNYLKKLTTIINNLM